MMELSLTTIIMLIGVAAFLVAVFTEVTKEIGFLKRIPTDLQVLVVSLVISIVGYFALATHYQIVFIWYHIVVAVIIGFLVAFVSMFGWEKIVGTFKRFTSLPDFEIPDMEESQKNK